jgi:hypothetical protein
LAVALVKLAGRVYGCNTTAIIIRTAEVAVVGLLMECRKMGMVLADTLYWLIIGMPLTYFFHHVVMHVPFNQTYNKGIAFYCWL